MDNSDDMWAFVMQSNDMENMFFDTNLYTSTKISPVPDDNVNLILPALELPLLLDDTEGIPDSLVESSQESQSDEDILFCDEDLDAISDIDEDCDQNTSKSDSSVTQNESVISADFKNSDTSEEKRKPDMKSTGRIRLVRPTSSYKIKEREHGSIDTKKKKKKNVQKRGIYARGFSAALNALVANIVNTKAGKPLTKYIANTKYIVVTPPKPVRR